MEHSRPDRISATVPIHSTPPLAPRVQVPYTAAAANRKPATPTKILYSVFTYGSYLSTALDWFQLSVCRRVFSGWVVVAYACLPEKPMAAIASWVFRPRL